MLQYITQPDDHYSIAEQIQMVIAGGCGWIVLGHNGIEDDATRQIADEFLSVCRDAGIILTFENRPTLARELGVHGVLLSDKSFNPSKIREDLGPEAIIGVVVDTPSTVATLKKMDIDYCVISPTLSIDRIADFVNEVRGCGIDMPIVVMGDYMLDDVPGIMSTGINGMVTGKWIAESDDPTQAFASFLHSITEQR